MNKPKISNARKTHIAEAKIFWKNVDYLKAINGLTDHDVACALKRSISTIYNRKSEPETTDLRDVYNAALYFGIEPAARLLIPLTAGLVEPFALDEEGEGNERHCHYVGQKRGFHSLQFKKRGQDTREA